MLVKFEKYWIEFSVVLAIAVVLDPRYKFPFIDWCYRKLYGYASSLQYLKVCEKLFSMFGVYVSNVLAPSTSSGRLSQATQEIEEQYANGRSLLMMQVCYFFISLFVFLFLFFISCYLYSTQINICFVVFICRNLILFTEWIWVGRHKKLNWSFT